MPARAGTPSHKAPPNRLKTLTRDRRESGHVAEMQRRRLLLATCEVVGEHGVQAATVGRICEQAGVSRRTFYECFADGEACLLATFDYAVERLAERVVPAYCTGASGKLGPWRERVRAALTVLLEQFDREPDLARMCVVESLRAGPAVLERRRVLLETLAAVVDEGRGDARAGTDPPPLTAQGVVGGALSVIHTRLLARPPATTGESRSADSPAPGGKPSSAVANPAGESTLVRLTGPLMAMIVHPYLGAAAARKELDRPAPAAPSPVHRNGGDPFKDLPIRFTYRTARVLDAIASESAQGAYPSNRQIADSAGIADEGQMSRLLARLLKCELIENHGQGHVKGEPNAWALTERGEAIHAAIGR